jgi:hypothetical protein
MDFLLRLEQAGFFAWVRESSSIWAYPTILFLHTIGLSMIVGINAGIDLRILGVAPEIPVSPMIRLFPVMWAGFVVNALSGVTLLIADATTKLTNPVFYIKLVFIALALANLHLIKTRIIRDPLVDKRPLPINAKIMAGMSLVFWAAAMTAGRLMAYIGPVSGIE